MASAPESSNAVKMQEEKNQIILLQNLDENEVEKLLNSADENALDEVLNSFDEEDLEILNYADEDELEKLLNSVDDKNSRMDILLSIGQACFDAADYSKSKEYMLRAANIADELNDKSGKAECFSNLGGAYLGLSDYENAIECYNKSLAINTELGDQSGIANSTGNLGIVYDSLGQYEKVIEYCNKSMVVSTEIGDRSAIASNTGILGNAYRHFGQYEKAIEYYNKSLAINTEIGDQSGIVKEHEHLGSAYRNLAQYEKAIEHYNKGLAISTEIGHRSGIASHTSNLGVVYDKLGQYEKAIEYSSKGLAISTEMGNRAGIAANIGNLGNAYRNLGQYENAIKYCDKSLEISTEIGDQSGMAIDNGNLGNAYRNLGQYAKAIVYYDKSLEISTEIGDRSGIARENGNLGNAYYKLGEHEKAIEYYNKGLAISTEIGDQSGIANNNANLGCVHISLEQYERAIEYFNKGLAISTEIGDRAGIAKTNGNLGFVYNGLEQYETAISILKKSVKCGDEIFFDLGVDENKLSFSNGYFEQYLTLMDSFILLERVEAALLVIDLGKAKALHAFIAARKNLVTADMVDYTHKTWQRIDDNEEKVEIDDIEKVIQLKENNSTVLFYSFDHEEFLNIWVLNGVDDIKYITSKQMKGQFSPEDYIFRCLRWLLQDFSVVLSRDSSLHNLSSDSTPGEPKIAEVGLSQISVGLNDKFIDAIEKSENLDLESFENMASQKFQSSDSVFLHNILDNSELMPRNVTEVVERYDLAVDAAKVRSPPPGQTSNSWSYAQGMLRALFDELIHPVKKFIKGTKLIIVPDKCLFFAPFSALTDETNCPLSANYSVQITPSLHTLYSSMKQSHHTSLGFALFVGNPTVGKVSFRGDEIELDKLANATAEAEYLASLFSAKPLVESEAVKERVLKLFLGAGIIHIAAHGDQKRGEIFLAPNSSLTDQGSSLPKEESYLLKEKDIIDISINARLVVLCCCHTGRGKTSSEGVIGLARAFLAAGARSVLATLWRLDDEGTKMFVENFYAEICNETSVCDALKRTMTMFQQHENDIYRKFGVWAPFIIFGEDVKFSKQDIEEIKTKSREVTF